MRRLLQRYALAGIVAVAAAFFASPASAQQGPQSATGLLNSAATVAACTTNSCISLPLVPLSVQSTYWVQVTNTFVGTIIVEGSIDGVNWTTGNVTAYGGAVTAASITAAGLYQSPAAPNTRVRMTSYTSGTATVSIYATNMAPSGVTTSTLATGAAVQILDSGGTNKANVNASGQQVIAGPLTGVNSTGTAGAVNQTIVAGGNFTTSPATLTTGNVGPIQLNNKGAQIVDAQYVGGAALGTQLGIPTTRMSQVNAAGGGCSGTTTLNGSNITKSFATATWTTTTTQVIALSASTVVHICHITITGVPSTGGTLSIITGTGSNCGTGTATIWSYTIGISTVGISIPMGEGDAGILDAASANAVCLGGSTFVGTITANITFAKY